MAKNDISLGSDKPLDQYLKPLKVGGENSVIELSSPNLNDESTKGKLLVRGDLEVTGNYINKTSRHHINGGFYSSSTSKFYLPLVGYVLEQSTITGRNDYVSHVCPYAGRLVKVTLRSETTPGDIIVGFHKSTDDTEVPNASATTVDTVNMSKANVGYDFDLGAKAVFKAGDIMAISITPDSLAVQDTNFCVVLEYYNIDQIIGV